MGIDQTARHKREVIAYHENVARVWWSMYLSTGARSTLNTYIRALKMRDRVKRLLGE